jgi:protein TonB
VITSPDWERRPDGSDFADAYPDRALRLEQAGTTAITCQVRANGTLTGCTVTREDPSGFGFGEASVKIARRFKMRPQTRDGAPVEGASVTIPIRWTLPG